MTPQPGQHVVTKDGDEGVVRELYSYSSWPGARVYVVIECADGVDIDVPAEDVVQA